MKSLNGTVLLISKDPSAPKDVESEVRDRGIDVQTLDSIDDFFERRDLDCATCLVLDMRQPDVEANASSEPIRAEQISIPVICIAGSSTTGLRPAKASGSADSVAFSRLLDTLASALGTAGTTRRMRSASGEIARKLRTLTPREHQVMERVVQGFSNKLIASELGISSRTIEIHRAHVMEKTGAEGLSDLVRMAFAVGAVGAPEKPESLEREA